MPPKPRVPGTTRGRGRGKGQNSGGRSIVAVETVQGEAAPPTESTATAETSNVASAQAAVTPQGFSDSSAQVISVEDSATVEPQVISSNPASSISSPHTVADLPAPRQVQRLESLRPTSSTSASPAVRRTTSTRGKKPAVKPSFTGRRAKEEREARIQQENERERQRKAERDAEARKAGTHKPSHRGGRGDRGGGRSRGGYTGPVSGPFSLGISSKSERKSSHAVFTGSRASRVKYEDDEDGYKSSSRSRGGGVKKEEDGNTSDENDDANFPRMDIDFIELSSDEDEAGTASRLGLPVRPNRREHHDRVIGINTELSTTAPVKSEQLDGTTDDAAKGSVTQASSRKGKGKAKDVEITKASRFYGMWDDDEEPPQVPIKPEPLSDDENTNAQGTGASKGVLPKKTQKQRTLSSDGERKPKPRSRGGQEPNLQTSEERAEWKRFQDGLLALRQELGPEADASRDAAGDVNMQDGTGAEAEPKQSIREEKVYLFQFPPVMPDLLPPGVRKEPAENTNKASEAPAYGASVEIKVEDADVEPAKAADGLHVAPGRAGKLRVRESGRTTLDWGGTSFVLHPGNRATFLQEVVSVKITPEGERALEEDGGDAVSFGRVKGKFVVTPDWSVMLG